MAFCGPLLRKSLGIAALSLNLLGGGFGASAQDAEGETLITSDGALQMTIPTGWTGEERPDGAVELTSPDSDAFLTVYTPNYLVETGLFPADMRSTATFMDSFRETATESGTMALDPSVKVALSTDLTAVRSDFLFTEQMGMESVTGAQFMLAVPVADRYVLVNAMGPDSATFIETVYAFARSLVLLDDTLPALGANPARSGAVGLATRWQDLVGLLESAGLITGDGELVWSASYLSTSVGGPVVIPDDSASDYPNMAGGALLSFRPDDDISTCGFMARVNSQQGAEQALLVGLSAEYELIVMDVTPETVGDPQVQWLDNAQTFFNPQQFVYVLRDNRVTILINGEIVAEDVEVALPEPNARGRAPIGRAGALLELSCVMTDAWAYGFREN